MKHFGKRLMAILLSCVLLLSLLPTTIFAAETGKIALLAVTADGFLIEPEYINYATGNTVKDVLKASGHTFTGIDTGFISGIDGKTDNYSLHYDGDGYALDASAENVTVIWFTTNANQSYGANLLALADNMTVYRTATNGVKDYAAAKEAYDAAVKGFYAADDAAAEKLNTALKNALKKYQDFLDGGKVTVTMDVTMGGEKTTPGTAVFTSEFGPVTTVNGADSVQLVPGSYQFDLSDGSFRHVRGTLEVTADTTLTAEIPAGKWIKTIGIGIDNFWKTYGEMPKSNENDYEATYLIPDFAYASLYPYFEPGEGLDTTNVRVYKAGDPNGNKARSWESKATALTDCLKDKSLECADVVCEARLKGGTYEQYQTFTLHLIRTASLTDIKAADAVSGLQITPEYTNSLNTYTVVTSQDQVKITPVTLCSGVAITVGGKPTQSGAAVAVDLADCEQDADKKYYLIPIVLTANGQDVTYTVKVQKRAAIPVILNHEDGLDVKVYSQTGDYIAPTSSTGTADTYMLTLGCAYSYLATKNVYFHAEHTFPAQPGMTLTVPTPITEDWLTNLGSRAGNKAPLNEMTPAFAAGVHEYTFTVESNTTNFQFLRARTDTSYKTTFYAAYHCNSAWPERTIERKLTGSDTSYTSIANFLAVGGYGNSGRLKVAQAKTVNGATLYQDYFINVVRSMTLTGLTAKDNNDVSVPLTQKGADKQGFEKLVYDYTADVGQRTSELRLTLRPLSTYRIDADMTVKVACGDWNQTLVYDSENKPNVERTVAVPLNTASAATEKITVTVSHKETGSVAGIYTIEVNKQPPVETSVITDPGDATVFLVADASKTRILPDAKGIYLLDTGSSYTLVVTRNGYVGKKLAVVAGEANKVIEVKLDKAPDSTLNDIYQKGEDWPLFRADENNNGVVNARTPITAEDTVLAWANKLGEGYSGSAVGSPIIVGGNIYTYSGTTIMKVDKETGLILKTAKMVGGSSFAINSPTYADGMIFIGLSNGRVQAFNAETLDSLWVYTDKLGGQPNCPIAYCDGYIYTGFWNSETKQANFACISVTDEDVTQAEEAKLATWTYTHNGFYWAGAYACKDYVLVTTDDGADGYTTGHGSVLSLNPKTGVKIDEVVVDNVGDLRSSICYDSETGAYYFTSKGGDMYQIRTNEDGTFVENSLKRLHLNNGSTNNQTPPMSTSTPVIYKGRAYIGVSGTSQFGAYSGHNITVVDLESFTIAYSVPTKGYPQTSGLLTTAYEDEDGYVYVYFFDNFTPGKLRVIRDKAGMKEVDHTYTTMETYNDSGEERTVEAAYVLFTPSGAQAQYAICSPIVDSEGNIYFKNDSAQLMRLSSRVTKLEVTQQPDRTAYEVGNYFDASGMKITAYYANGTTKDVTAYVKYTTEKLTADDTEITVAIDLDKPVKETLEKSTDKEQTAKWQLYQDKDGKDGISWEIPTTTVTITVADGHTYGEPDWTWNEDFTASAAFTCANEGHTETVPATVTNEVTTDAGCETAGIRTYTAKVTFEGKDYTTTKTEVIPATGHAYGEPDWTWNEDFTAAATFTCANNAAHTKTLDAAVTSEVNAPSTCEENGSRTYTAKVTFEGKDYTAIKTEVIGATGHAYGEPVWTWNEDFTAAATFTCANDPTHTKTVTADVSNEVTLEASCEGEGVRTYTARINFEGENYTSTKTEAIAAAGHQPEHRNAKDATCTDKGYTGDTVCKVCEKVLETGKPIDALGHNFENGKCTRCGKAAPAEPVTGDSVNPVVLWVCMAGAAAAALMLFLLRKKQHSNK